MTAVRNQSAEETSTDQLVPWTQVRCSWNAALRGVGEIDPVAMAALVVTAPVTQNASGTETDGKAYTSLDSVAGAMAYERSTGHACLLPRC